MAGLKHLGNFVNDELLVEVKKSLCSVVEGTDFMRVYER